MAPETRARRQTLRDAVRHAARTTADAAVKLWLSKLVAGDEKPVKRRETKTAAGRAA